MAAGRFEFRVQNHVEAILATDFPEPLCELCDVLSALSIKDEELIRGGGGEASFTQRLRKALSGQGWQKRKIEIQKIVNGKARAGTTHEIDHFPMTENGAIALEIEWNTRDPF